jgi:hypothetical protein
LVEHATENRSVGGSIPPLGTIFAEFWLIPERLRYASGDVPALKPTSRATERVEFPMRLVISLVVIVYLVGVGVVLAPVVSGKWNSVPASELFASVTQALPAALAWPVAAYRNLTGTGPVPADGAPEKTTN